MTQSLLPQSIDMHVIVSLCQRSLFYALHYLYLGHRPPLLPGIRNQIVLEFSQIYIKSSLKPTPIWFKIHDLLYSFISCPFFVVTVIAFELYFFIPKKNYSAYFSFFLLHQFGPDRFGRFAFIGYRQTKYIRFYIKGIKIACFFQYYT